MHNLFANVLVDWFVDNTKQLIFTGVIIAVDIILLLILKLISKKIKKGTSNRATTLTGFIQGVAAFVVIIISLFIIIGLWGVNTTIAILIFCAFLIVFALGSFGLMNEVFLGMNNIYSNVYEIGDYVSINGFDGKVINVAISKIQVQSKTGEIKTIANSVIKEVTNYSRSYQTALVDITVVNNSKIFDLINLFEEKLPSLKEEYNTILEGPLVNGIENIENNNVTIRISAKTTYEKKNTIERAIRKRVLEICNSNNIALGAFNIKEEK